MSSWARLLGILLARWVGEGLQGLEERAANRVFSGLLCGGGAMLGGRGTYIRRRVCYGGLLGAEGAEGVVGGGRCGVAMRLLLAIFAVVGLHYISEQSVTGQDEDEDCGAREPAQPRRRWVTQRRLAFITIPHCQWVALPAASCRRAVCQQSRDIQTPVPAAVRSLISPAGARPHASRS
jgi:hypothetical protein